MGDHGRIFMNVLSVQQLIDADNAAGAAKALISGLSTTMMLCKEPHLRVLARLCMCCSTKYCTNVFRIGRLACSWRKNASPIRRSICGDTMRDAHRQLGSSARVVLAMFVQTRLPISEPTCSATVGRWQWRKICIAHTTPCKEPGY